MIFIVSNEKRKSTFCNIFVLRELCVILVILVEEVGRRIRGRRDMNTYITNAHYPLLSFLLKLTHQPPPIQMVMLTLTLSDRISSHVTSCLKKSDVIHYVITSDISHLLYYNL